MHLKDYVQVMLVETVKLNLIFPGLLGIVHGHNYFVTVEIGVEDTNLNKDGMVIDFKLMKQLIHSYFDQYDHSMILTADNPLVEIYRKNYAEHGLSLDQTRLFVWKENPTAEYMAKKWHSDLVQVFNSVDSRKKEIAVTVEETQHNSVTYKQ